MGGYKEYMKKTTFFAILTTLLFILLLSTACGNQNVSNTDEVQEENTTDYEENKESDEWKEPDSAVEIQVSWTGVDVEDDTLVNLNVILQGILDDGTRVQLCEENPMISDANGNLIANYSKNISDDKGIITISIYEDDSIFILSGEDADYTPDNRNNNISQVNGVASVTDKDGNTYEYDSKSRLSRSYTGVWHWIICNLDHGLVCEYNPSVLDTNDELNSTIEMGRDGKYVSTLVGESAEERSDIGNIRSISIEDGFIIVEGSFKYTEGVDVYDGEVSSFDTYIFPVSQDIEYMAGGGEMSEENLSEEEFLEIAHYYNGLALILIVQDQTVIRAIITS